jgi:large subunit ribosomal protein L24
MKIKKGDNVKVLAGKDRGKTGKVLAVSLDAGRVTVEGVNVYAKRVRPKRQNQKGETVHLPRPLHASNVQLVCGSCKKVTRVRMRQEGETKTRTCTHCQAAL